MPTYAILGATGQTGSHILQLLLRDHPAADVNVLVRSRAKLEAMLPPDLVPLLLSDNKDNNSSRRLHVYEGTITDVPLLSACLAGATTAFLTVATMYNEPHTRIAQDQAEAVVAALEGQRQEQIKNKGGGGDDKKEKSPHRPLLVMISSAETEEDPFCLDTPWPVRKFIACCNYWIYADLVAAEAYLRRRADWVDTVFFKPGGIAHDVQRGHILSFDKSQTFVSFWDVAAAMIDCGCQNDREAMAGKSVSLLAKSKAKFPTDTPMILLRNLMGTLFPRLYQWLS